MVVWWVPLGVSLCLVLLLVFRGPFPARPGPCVLLWVHFRALVVSMGGFGWGWGATCMCALVLGCPCSFVAAVWGPLCGLCYGVFCGWLAHAPVSSMVGWGALDWADSWGCWESLTVFCLVPALTAGGRREWLANRARR